MSLVTDLMFVVTDLVCMLHTVDMMVYLYAIFVYCDKSFGNQIVFCKQSGAQYAGQVCKCCASYL